MGNFSKKLIHLGGFGVFFSTILFISQLLGNLWHTTPNNFYILVILQAAVPILFLSVVISLVGILLSFSSKKVVGGGVVARGEVTHPKHSFWRILISVGGILISLPILIILSISILGWFSIVNPDIALISMPVGIISMPIGLVIFIIGFIGYFVTKNN
jgi:uncharacterized membrane protein YcjF (UPF0283 family)